MRDIHCFFNENKTISIQKHQKLLAVVTPDNHLWPTDAWNKESSVLLHKICTQPPFTMLTANTNHCPFCGLDVKNPTAHGMNCMIEYAKFLARVK